MQEPKPLIVIVDDNRVQLRLHELALRDLAVELHMFCSPKKAISFLASTDAALILLDIVMQELDGITVLKRLRETMRHAKTPVLFVTGKDYQEDRASATALGALEYLVKPMSPGVLRAMVAKYALTSARA